MSWAIDFDDAEFDGVFLGGGNGGYGDFGVFGHVVLDHAGDVHAVDVVAAENCDHVRPGLLDEVDVLEDGVGSALVPGFVLGAHLGGHRDDKVALEEAGELPAFAEVL